MEKAKLINILPVAGEPNPSIIFPEGMSEEQMSEEQMLKLADHYIGKTATMNETPCAENGYMYLLEFDDGAQGYFISDEVERL